MGINEELWIKASRQYVVFSHQTTGDNVLLGPGRDGQPKYLYAMTDKEELHKIRFEMVKIKYVELRDQREQSTGIA